MKLRWRVAHVGTDLARIEASTMHKLHCGCDIHYTAVPVDMVECGGASLVEIIEEFQYMHKTTGCPRNE